MGDIRFECVGAAAVKHAATPTMSLRLRLTETTGTRVGAVLLRCQIHIEPRRRRYSAAEGERLNDLFGTADRWSDTQKPLLLTGVTVTVPAFADSTVIDVPVAFTYDLEVAAGRYFASLDDGEIPLLLMFSGTVFRQGPTGLLIEQVPWHKECAFALPVRDWREVVDGYFPNSGWLMLRRDTIDALGRFKSRRALASWNDTVAALLSEVDESLEV